MKIIPYSHQRVTGEDIREVGKALRSEWLTQGPRVGAFEDALARFTGARFCAAFSSGTAALHAAYVASGLSPGDEVITTPLTFAATANAALWQGGRIVFSDIDPKTGNLDPIEAEKKITSRTRVIAAVDYAGLPAELDAFKRMCRSRNLIFIEDAAQSLGALYKGKKVGGIADMTILSFHPVKSVTTGEGGAVLTNRRDWYEKLKMFGNHGITKDPKKMKRKKQGGWYYEMRFLGQNYRLTDIQAALGRSQLKHIGRFLEERRNIAARYRRELAGIPGLILPEEPEGSRSSWHLYPVRLAGAWRGRRAEIFSGMRSSGIGVQVHHIPVYLHPYYQTLGYKKGLCPNAEHFYDTEISLPVFPGLGVSRQRRVVAVLKRLLLYESGQA